MLALVDIANISFLHRNRGLVHIASRIVEAIGPAIVANNSSIHLRLYGGWFEGRSLSRHAQRLVPEVRGDFPRLVKLTTPIATTTARVSIDLAASLLCDPPTQLTHTYRPRSIPPDLRCATTPFAACAAPAACPITSIASFFSARQCPLLGCAVEPATILNRAEQKLVDAMIIVDLLHAARTQAEPLVDRKSVV